MVSLSLSLSLWGESARGGKSIKSTAFFWPCSQNRHIEESHVAKPLRSAICTKIALSGTVGGATVSSRFPFDGTGARTNIPIEASEFGWARLGSLKTPGNHESLDRFLKRLDPQKTAGQWSKKFGSVTCCCVGPPKKRRLGTCLAHLSTRLQLAS